MTVVRFGSGEWGGGGGGGGSDCGQIRSGEGGGVAVTEVRYGSGQWGKVVTAVNRH